MEPTREELEELLRASRPLPRTEFVRDLEESLNRSLERPRVPRGWPKLPGRRLVVASGFGVAIAGCTLALSVAGALPLDIGGARDAAADRECSTTTRWKVERRPVFEVDGNGQLRLRYKSELVPRRVTRCQ